MADVIEKMNFAPRGLMRLDGTFDTISVDVVYSSGLTLSSLEAPIDELVSYLHRCANGYSNLPASLSKSGHDSKSDVRGHLLLKSRDLSNQRKIVSILGNGSACVYQSNGIANAGRNPTKHTHRRFDMGPIFQFIEFPETWLQHQLNKERENAT